MENTEENEYAGAISGYYDKMSDKYSQVVEKVGYGVPGWLERKLDATGPQAPRVLDLGCANGHLGGIVRRKFPSCHMTGVDISPKMIGELKRAGLYDEALVWDLSRGLPDLDGVGFDMVLAIGFMEFLKDPLALIKGVASALRPSGQCLGSFEVFDAAKYGSRMVDNPGAGFPRYLYERRDLDAMFAAAGLRAESCETITAYISPTTGEQRSYHVFSLRK